MYQQIVVYIAYLFAYFIYIISKTQQGTTMSIYQPGLPEQSLNTHIVKFYTRGLFGFRSAAQRFQSDCKRMQTAGWRLHHAPYLGTDLRVKRNIVATYEK